MAAYKINQRNVFFQGNPGDLVEISPGPFLDAAVISGILTRMDVQKDSKNAPQEPSKKRKEKE